MQPDLTWTYEFCYAGGAVFDASQYAFFGNEVLEEIELGGLEDDQDLSEAKFEDDEHLLEQEEVYIFVYICSFLLSALCLCLDFVVSKSLSFLISHDSVNTFVYIYVRLLIVTLLPDSGHELRQAVYSF
ncbi:hypothetical protein Hanom_Chr11g00994081 [Helianthus anomalus]